MTYVFEIIDKSGRNIKLTLKSWKHIMKRHSYMEKYVEQIKETLKIPDKITDRGYSKQYYKGYKNLKSPNRFILVVVKYINDEGLVITAYQTDKIRWN